PLPACVSLLRPAPAPPPCPYTTLFRSEDGHANTQTATRGLAARRGRPAGHARADGRGAAGAGTAGRGVRLCAGHAGRVHRGAGRSEEHTSELPSRENLVCRRLLRKKTR